MSLQTLNETMIESGCNQHDRAITLIKACIEIGVNRGPAIVSKVSGLGFDKRFVGLTLTKSAGRNPARHHWVRGDDDLYRLHT